MITVVDLVARLWDLHLSCITRVKFIYMILERVSSFRPSKDLDVLESRIVKCIMTKLNLKTIFIKSVIG